MWEQYDIVNGLGLVIGQRFSAAPVHLIYQDDLPLYFIPSDCASYCVCRVRSGIISLRASNGRALFCFPHPAMFLSTSQLLRVAKAQRGSSQHAMAAIQKRDIDMGTTRPEHAISFSTNDIRGEQTLHPEEFNLSGQQENGLTLYPLSSTSKLARKLSLQMLRYSTIGRVNMPKFVARNRVHFVLRAFHKGNF